MTRKVSITFTKDGPRKKMDANGQTNQKWGSPGKPVEHIRSSEEREEEVGQSTRTEDEHSDPHVYEQPVSDYEANIYYQSDKNGVFGNCSQPSQTIIKYPKKIPANDPRYLRLKDGETTDDPSEDKLPVWRKIFFAVGGAPYQMTTNIIGFFLNIFLLEVAEISPKYISIILFTGKAWDAITDPSCGYLVNRTSTRFGKMRPWILFSTPFSCVAYFFLWYVPDVSEEAKAGYYLVMFFLFEGLLSGLHVPYTSLTMYISNNQKERDSATAYRMISEAVGVLLSVIIQGKLIEKYRTAGQCVDPDTTPTPQQLENQKWSYRTGSLIVISIYLVCSLTVFFGVKERKGLVSDKDHKGFFRGVKAVLTFGPFVKAAMAFLFLSLALSIVQGNLALYCTHSLKMGGQFSNFITVLLVVSILSMPLWQLCLLKFGKKTTWAAGMMIIIPVLIGHLYLPKGNAYAYYVAIVIAGFSISVSLLLPWSVLPDILDLFMLEKNTRKDAIFYSFYVFFNKLAIGLGLAVSQLVLQFGGYETGACDQPESVDLTLRLLIVPAPVLFIIIALMFLWSYPIDEKKRREIKQEVLDSINKIKSKQEEVATPEQSSVSYESIRITSSTEL